MVLVSLELGGRLHLPASPYMRVSWKVPVLLVLLVLFVVPHDPSSRLQKIGSLGFRVSAPMSALRSRFASKPFAERSSAPPAPSFRPASRTAPQPSALQGLLPSEEPSLQQQLLGVLEAQLSSRQLRQVRVARWRAQRLLHASASAVELSAADVWPDLLPDLMPDAWPDLLGGAGWSAAPYAAPYAAAAEERATTATAATAAAFASCNASLSVHTSVDELRAVYGGRRRWYGDLDIVETRALYHELLPTHLVTDQQLPLPQRARLAVSARRAARLYARERALLPLATGSQLLDGLRQLADHGTFQPDGLSEEQIFCKYAERLGVPPPDWDAYDDADDDGYTDFYLTVLRKSCSTNAQVDGLTAAIGRGVAVGGGVGGGVQLTDALRSGADGFSQFCQMLTDVRAQS